MSAKKRLILAIVLLQLTAFSGIMVVYGSYYWVRKHYPPVMTQAKIPSKYADMMFDTISEWDANYQLHVMYPQIDQPAIGRATKVELDSIVDSFRAKLAKRSTVTPGPPYELNIIAEVNFANKTAINLVYSTYTFTGSIHDKQLQNRMYDLKTGKRITTSQLFKNDAYLASLSAKIREALPKQLGESYNQTLAESGTTPKIASFSQFEVTDKQTISIIFEPGRVAPVAQGVIRVPIALRSIDDHLNQNLIAAIFPDYVAQIAAERAAAAEEAKKQQELAAQVPVHYPSAPPLRQADSVNCALARCVALTFDDGPGAGTTTILDTLKKYNAKASFFVIGRQVPGQAELVRRIAAEGHDIGNHTWDHRNLAALGTAGVLDEINSTQLAVISATGRKPFMVRPPGGSYTQATITAAGLPFILWSVDPNDWRDRSASTVYNRVMPAVRTGSIVLSHDIYPSTAQAYTRIIPELLQQGYSLVTVSNLLGIDANNPPARVFRSR